MTKEKLMDMSIERLCELFEMTETITNSNKYMVRGWLMDAIEAKNPEGFDNWLDSDEDGSCIRKYVLA